VTGQARCHCGNPKRKAKQFCNRCFFRLPHELRTEVAERDPAAIQAANDFLYNAQAADGHPRAPKS